MFQNAQNFTNTGGEINAVGRDYIKIIYNVPNTSSSDQIPPLTPLQSPSDFFTGRDRYLQALKVHFSPKLDSERKKFLLYGMGGIGKTQICLKFIEQYGKKWFSDIFWVDASSEHTIELCLRQIAQKHTVDESTLSAESGLEWISCRSDWLLVFDNADGGYQVVEKFIPPGNGGSILITSRDKGAHLEVTEMGEEEAIVLLLKAAMIDNNSNVAMTAQKLVAALGCIPLAIDQAGAYVQSCSCGLDYYLALFIKHRAKLMSDKEFNGASLYQYSTYGTWDISIAEIRHRAEGESIPQRLEAESALILLNIFAFLHHDNISGEIFEKAALNFMAKRDEVTNSLPQSISLLDSKMLFLKDDGNWDALQFQAGIKLLISFSLIRGNGGMYSIHPLIQTWSRDRIPEGNILNCCKKSRSLLACSVKLDYEEDNYRFCTLLAPHIKRNDEYAAQWISDEQYCDDQNEIFGFVFDRVGDWNEAEKLYSASLHAREAWLGRDDLDTIHAMHSLASMYRNQGKWIEAESLEVQVMELRMERLGALHPDTLSAMNNLALTYRDRGKWMEAEILQVKVMELRKEKLGALHLDTLRAMNNLAFTYTYQGKWMEAESLQVKVMELRTEKLGALHPHTLNTMSNLAVTYSDQGKWMEAESLQLKVMEGRTEKLGALHPDTLTAMSNLAVTYRGQGKWMDTESLQVKVMELRKEKLGAFHPHTLTAMSNLAVTYGDQRKWMEAESLQVKVMELRKEKIGALHPDTLIAMNNLALTYSNQGKWMEAESLQVKVMELRMGKLEALHPDTLSAMKSLQVKVIELRKERLGALHPDTLVAMNNLAVTYSDQGKWLEAESLQVKVMELRKEKLGALHPDTLSAMNNLAVTYSNQGKWMESESLQVKVMELRKEKLGALHLDTISAMNNLAITYSDQGKWMEAEILQVKVMELRKEKLGALHPDTLSAMNNLALTYSDQGKWMEAESLQVKVMELRKEELGVLHPDTLSAMGNLAFTYRDQGKQIKAKELLETSINGMQQVLGTDHPTTIYYNQVLTNSTWHAEGKAPKNTIKNALHKVVNQIRSKVKAKRG
ncbi:hypothetical protein M378DRAFT_16498 [Amanita muscaria Koide BX008]|uniref:Kinesin light chain n=1 Tax=Amanita muscaria (strain Koide BX008) TaxID=946122 RepID=A0A0C2W7F3_AMAMK|nr:hypothetical protein M378DRAFT_16498 [Amanita muscaria Koide BX008]